MKKVRKHGMNSENILKTTDVNQELNELLNLRAKSIMGIMDIGDFLIKYPGTITREVKDSWDVLSKFLLDGVSEDELYGRERRQQTESF